MLRVARMLTLMALLQLVLPLLAAAQDVEVADEPPVSPPPPEITRSGADLIDGDLLRILLGMWGPVGRDEPQLTDGDNVTVLSIPEGCAVYVASVAEINSAGTEGQEATVENVVFNDEHFLGTTPLTMTAPPGNHVLAIRSTARLNGFDGGCVRKTTHDVITGGKRHAYHLYPLRKLAGQYQCFVANFAELDKRVDDAVLAIAERGTFAIPEEELAMRLVNETTVANDDLARVVARLNQLGVTLFTANGTEYLVKLTLVGNDFELMAWPVE